MLDLRIWLVRMEVHSKRGLELGRVVFAVRYDLLNCLALGSRIDRSEDFLRQNWERGVLEFRVIHVAGNDRIVVRKALNHQILYEFFDSKLEFIEGIGERGIN